MKRRQNSNNKNRRQIQKPNKEQKILAKRRQNSNSKNRRKIQKTKKEQKIIVTERKWEGE
jgi:hypothetical protein